MAAFSVSCLAFGVKYDNILLRWHETKEEVTGC